MISIFPIPPISADFSKIKWVLILPNIEKGSKLLSFLPNPTFVLFYTPFSSSSKRFVVVDLHCNYFINHKTRRNENDKNSIGRAYMTQLHQKNRRDTE